MSDSGLIALYPLILMELKERDIIRTNNLVDEIGKYIAVSYYNKTVGLSKLQRTMVFAKNVDAIINMGGKIFY